ncbi:LCP family protein [Streptomyces sp. NPDC001339]|uniref:LCP family protein n=1 Tax=Streptomyces sp. NPDC001339 TaxID=3364563 RepID=UPI0036BD9050
MNPRRSNQHRKQAPRRLGRKLLLCTLTLVLCAGAGGWYLYRDLARQIGSSYALDDGSPRSAGGDTNILLMGLDSRKDQNGEDLPADVLDKLHAGSSDIGGYNTNTLILLHVPGDGSRATAFSIPRDDFVDIPGHGKDKIKKAYGLAKARKEGRLYQQGVRDKHQLEHDGREAGRRAEIETVRSFLGVPIDHFAEVNLVGFLHIADSLGGVEVCLKKPAKDRYSGADFKAGRQTLNGPQSLAFVRQRHGLPAGDLDRTRRQQAFLASATHKLNSAGTFTDPGRLLKLLDTAKKDLVIDEGWDLLSFIKQARNLSGGNVEFSTLPIEGFGRHNGEDINRVDPGKIRRLVAERLGKGRSSGEKHSPSANDGNTPTSGPSSPATTAPTAPPAPTLDDGAIPCVD